MAKQNLYKDVAERILAAVRELNAALVEAHAHPQVRVHMRYPEHKTIPFQYGCEVTRVTKHAIAAEGDEIKQWQMSYKVAMKADPSKKKGKSKKAKKSKAVRRAA